jgi:hypothetical protein
LYVNLYLNNVANYFSLLRPLSELQIAYIFSKLNKEYRKVFKSCNVGSKNDVWCLNCSKCLFVYIILSPFLTENELLCIFKENLLTKKSLFNTRKELQGLTDKKPFECVGSVSEINIALRAINQKNSNELKNELKKFDNTNNVNANYLQLLKKWFKK